MLKNSFLTFLSGIAILVLMSGCTEKEPENTPPTAVFNVNTNTGTIETLFIFDASAISDKEDSASQIRVRWDWESDGKWDTDYSTEKIIKKGFNKKGFYKVTLEAADTKGLTSRYSEIVNIEDYFITDVRDGQQYRTVKIGDQLWMAKNLNYESFEGSYCHGNDPDKCLEYGRLYQWEAAVFACPDGWRLPSENDWDILTGFLGEKAGVKIKSDHGWTGDYNGTNSSGFNALPGSYLTQYGEFMALGGYAFFWTSGESTDNRAWCRQLSYNVDNVERNHFNKLNAFSVRCISIRK